MFVNICHSIERERRNHHQEHSLGVPGVNTNTLSGWLEEYQSCWSYIELWFVFCKPLKMGLIRVVRLWCLTCCCLTP